MDDKTIEKLEQRISRLEKAVFGGESKPARKAAKDFKGATGGIRFLISKGFFKTKRDLGAVRAELQKNGYHYKRQVVNTTLGRLSRRGGPLVSINENGKKVYVERK
jgi:hypothetical protein